MGRVFISCSDVQVNGLEPASEEEQQHAAVKIQAGIRGYRDRQRVKALRSVVHGVGKVPFELLSVVTVYLLAEVGNYSYSDCLVIETKTKVIWR